MKKKQVHFMNWLITTAIDKCQSIEEARELNKEIRKHSQDLIASKWDLDFDDDDDLDDYFDDDDDDFDDDFDDDDFDDDFDDDDFDDLDDEDDPDKEI